MTDGPLLGGRLGGAGAWGRELLEASRDREDQLRAARPVVPSSSRIPSRCNACREWSSDDGAGLCVKCRCPWEAASLIGLAPVRVSGKR